METEQMRNALAEAHARMSSYDALVTRGEEMEGALTEAREKLTQQAALLERLTTAPLIYATVVALSGQRPTPEVPSVAESGTRIRVTRGQDFVGESGVVQVLDADDYILVQFDGGNQAWIHPNRYEIEKPNLSVIVSIEGKLTEVLSNPDLSIEPGDTVKLSPETMQIVDVASIDAVGEIAVIRRIVDDMAEVDCEGNTRVVFIGKCEPLEKGDRVILDPSQCIVTRNLGKQEERFTFTGSTNVSWDDIGGLDDAKRAMIEAIEAPHRHADLYTHYGKKPVKGILLYGPPGCGKTMLGKAGATSLATLYGNQASDGFLYVKGPEILEKFVGMAEASIRQIFERARRHQQTHGYTAVIFIDEADAILGKRGMGISSDIERTIVPMFLTEMDGLEESGALVILATNRPDVLDPAIVRDKRIDRKVKVGRPSQDNAARIFQLYLDDIPLNNGYTVPELAVSASAELFSGQRVLYTVSLKGGTSMDFTLAQLVNGGMIAGIVDQATSIALRSDIEAGKPQGLCYEHLVRAVDDVFKQNHDLGHHDELTDFVHDFRDDVTGIQRLRVGAV